jgi:OTT_1508-like deaminase
MFLIKKYYYICTFIILVVLDMKDRHEKDILLGRKENKVTQSERRIDSLARVLAPKDNYTKCVASILFEDKLVISANHPHSGGSGQLKTIIKDKYEILKNFLNEKISADEAFEKLKDCGGLVSKQDADDRIKLDLSNLLASIKEGKLNLPEQSPFILIPGLYETFNLLPDAKLVRLGYENKIKKLQDDITNLKYKPSRERIQDDENLKRLEKMRDKYKKVVGNLENKGVEIIYNQVHAEQVAARYIQKIKSDAVFYVGVSKLCCDTCSKALKEKKLRYRGTHGGYYPTFSLLEEKFRAVDRNHVERAKNLYPDDSDSESENIVPNSDIIAPEETVPFLKDIAGSGKLQAKFGLLTQGKRKCIEEEEKEEGEIIEDEQTSSEPEALLKKIKVSV